MNLLIRIICFFNNYIKYKFFYNEIKFFSEFNSRNEKTALSMSFDEGCKVCIYGFGPYGEEYFIKLFKRTKIIGIYDINFNNIDGFVESPDRIKNNDFDYVIVTVMDNKARNSVTEFLFKKNIPESKIIYVNYYEN